MKDIKIESGIPMPEPDYGPGQRHIPTRGEISAAAKAFEPDYEEKGDQPESGLSKEEFTKAAETLKAARRHEEKGEQPSFKAAFPEGTTFELGDAHIPPAKPEGHPDIMQFVKERSKDYATLEHENEMLRIKLENAELRAKLAESKTAPAAVASVSQAGVVARPMPTKDEIPKGLPPMPKVDPAAGDKTPEVVAWFKKYWPEEYALRYKGRKTVFDDLRRRNPDADDAEQAMLDREEAKEARAPDFKPCKGEDGLDCSPRSFDV